MRTPTNFPRSTLTLALLAVFSAPSYSSEQSSEGLTELDAVTVFGETYRNTATKTALEPEETPQGITIIDQEQLDQRGVTSVNQALRYVAGASAENRGNSVIMFDDFKIRGFSTKNVNYYDGLSMLYLNGWNLQPQVDMVAVQQVEVFKGPTSVLYGAMPPGGMVNMIAKAPQQQAATTLGLATGSRNLIEASIDTTGQIADSDVSYRLIALARKQDSQVDNAEEERYVLAPSIDWQATDSTLINVNLYYQNDPEMGMNSSMPLEVLKKSEPSVSMGDVNWSQFERELLMVGYKIHHQFNSNWTFLQNARVTKADLYQENTYHATAVNPDGTLTRYPYSTDEELKGFVIDNQVSGAIDIAGVENNLLFGVDYQSMDGDVAYTSYSVAPGSGFVSFDPLNPNNNALNRADVTEAGVYLDDTEATQLGIYLQDQIRLGNLVVIAGGRFDQYESQSDYYAHESNHDHFTYRVGALYELDSGWSPFVSYATSFEPAPGVDKNGSAFDPETGEQAEVGVKYLSQDMSTSASASFFHITKKNALMADPTNIYGPKIQVGEAVSQGVELEARWYANQNFDLSAAYTYLDMEITKDAGNGLQGTTPIYVPTHSANLWANYHVYAGALAGTRISGGARYVGEMEMDATNTQGKVPSYTSVDLSLGYELGQASESLSGAEVNLIANNLFDEEYYSCYDQNNCWFGAERSLELNVKYAF